MFGGNIPFNIHRMSFLGRRASGRGWPAVCMGPLHLGQCMTTDFMRKDQMERDVYPAPADAVLALKSWIH
jgi:hypothetical protein